MKVIRALLLSNKPRHIRDLATEYSLSPSGVSDIVKRLQSAGVLVEVKEGNKRGLILSIPKEEEDCLRALFKLFEQRAIAERAATFAKRAKEKLQWMDEAYEFYHGLKDRR